MLSDGPSIAKERLTHRLETEAKDHHSIYRSTWNRSLRCTLGSIMGIVSEVQKLDVPDITTKKMTHLANSAYKAPEIGYRIYLHSLVNLAKTFDLDLDFFKTHVVR